MHQRKFKLTRHLSGLTWIKSVKGVILHFADMPAVFPQELQQKIKSEAEQYNDILQGCCIFFLCSLPVFIFLQELHCTRIFYSTKTTLCILFCLCDSAFALVICCKKKMPITANQISIPDGYRRLPYKTIAGFAWAADLPIQPRYLGMVWKKTKSFP
jgi:hypothetical protein